MLGLLGKTRPMSILIALTLLRVALGISFYSILQPSPVFSALSWAAMQQSIWAELLISTR